MFEDIEVLGKANTQNWEKCQVSCNKVAVIRGIKSVLNRTLQSCSKAMRAEREKGSPEDSKTFPCLYIQDPKPENRR